MPFSDQNSFPKSLSQTSAPTHVTPLFDNSDSDGWATHPDCGRPGLNALLSLREFKATSLISQASALTIGILGSGCSKSHLVEAMPLLQRRFQGSLG